MNKTVISLEKIHGLVRPHCMSGIQSLFTQSAN